MQPAGGTRGTETEMHEGLIQSNQIIVWLETPVWNRVSAGFTKYGTGMNIYKRVCSNNRISFLQNRNHFLKTLKAPQMVIIPQQLYNMFNLYNCGGPGVTK